MTGTLGFSWVGLLLLGAAVLGAGHIGIHLFHRREIGKEANL